VTVCLEDVCTVLHKIALNYTEWEFQAFKIVVVNCPKCLEMTLTAQKIRAELGLTMDELKRVNDRLEAAGNPVRVRLKGKNLALRATLPKKPEHGLGRKQYDISLKLSASKGSLKRAEREASKLYQHLVDGSFDWKIYTDPRHDPQSKPIAQLVEEFKAEYISKSPPKRRMTEQTWRTTWQGTFNKLPQTEPLSEAIVLAVVHSVPEDSRNRELVCQRLQQLCTYSGLEMDLSAYQGDYEPEPREIPNDDFIVEWRNKIPNRNWQWVYGMLAAFGLRPHEVFRCEFIDPLRLKVYQDTKTGSRITRAIHPNWAQEWDLVDVRTPKVQNTTARACGGLVSRQFAADRYNLPLVPYDLRHAWAIRASVAKRLPISTAAAMMGHSPLTHQKVYHRWLNDAENERVYQELILGDRGNQASG
jgi:integrase